MEEQTQTPLTERKVVRRGLIAGLAGLGAAAMLKLAGSDRAEADHNTTSGYVASEVMHVGVLNDGGNPNTAENITDLTARTTLVAAIDSEADCAFRVRNLGPGAGIEGYSMAGGDGVRGIGGPTTTGTIGFEDGRGVVGTGGSSTAGTNLGGIGVDAFGGFAFTGIGGRGVRAVGGTSTNNAGGNGVEGTGGSGVVGGGGVVGVGGNGSTVATRGSGVIGTSTSSVNAGVRGFNGNAGPGVIGTSTSGIGVRGTSNTQPGVEGTSVDSLGVRGLSTNFVGVVGISTGNHGLYGSSGSATAAGLVGENTGGGLAGVFNGNVQVFGAFQVFGAKNAIIRMPDGTYGSVYCQESPEPYFEDFGRAQLAGGVANVPLEREFAALVAGGDYMVFPVAEGDTRGLYISRRTPTGFEVRESQGGTSSVSFTYRIVTKRKDIEGRRFARVSDDAAKSVAAVRASLGVTGTPAGNLPGISPPMPQANPQMPGESPAGNNPSDGNRGGLR